MPEIQALGQNFGRGRDRPFAGSGLELPGKVAQEIVYRGSPVYITALSESQETGIRHGVICCRSVRRLLNGLDCCTRCEQSK
jgi:hypothetical protein